MSRGRRLSSIALAVYWLGLFVVTHLPPRNVPRTHVNDKIEHFVAYAILAALVFVVAQRLGGARAFAIAVAVCLMYGAIDEWTQLLVGRSCEVNDWLADAGGAIVGSLVALISCRAFAGATPER
ncbi:hypothetical protein BH09PLA1_BH09PLA1_03050 [soil metagenome]